MIAIEKNAASTQPATEMRRVKLLAVIDGSEATGRVLDYIKKLAESQARIEAVLLNVQPLPAEGRLRGYGSFKQKEIHDRLINELGKRAITAAGKRLDQMEITHTDRIELGDATTTILRISAEETCDVIVMGEPSAGPLKSWLIKSTGLLLGSTAVRVLARAKVPVVVVN